MTDLIEGNKLIAEFLNLSFEAAYTGANSSRFDKWLHAHPYYWISAAQMRYHISWDWLMPVVEKIESLDFITRIEQYPTKLHCMVIWNDAEDCPVIQESDYKKINATWLGVVSFIQWYNQQPK